MKKFAEELQKILVSYNKPRPFICEGNPLDTEFFIVGINSATEMNKDFWSFWSNENGYDKKEWLKHYILERSLKTLKPNRTRRNKISNTRQRIEWIANSILPIKTLETNLFVKATPTAGELKKEDRESLVFEYLLKTIKPKLIFIHGNEVKDYLEKIFEIEITKNIVNDIKIFDIETKIISMNHLSRGWSKQKSIDTGHLIRKIISNE